MKILFLNLDVGFFNPQKGQTAAERLISFRQAGQSWEFFLLLFDIVAQLPDSSVEVVLNISRKTIS